MPRTKKTETKKKVAIIPKKVGGLKVDVLDTKGKVKDSITLPKEIFDAKVNPSLMAQAIRVYLANQRSGSASTKTRGQVRGSTRKIWRQKGTGRARHGGIRAPIFVGGGVVFGPKPRDYSLKLSKKMKKAALFSALSNKRKDGQVIVVSGLEKLAPKTKDIASVFEKLNLIDNKNTLLVLPGHTENVQKAARNIAGVSILPAANLNTYEVLKSTNLIFMQDAIVALQNHFLRSNNE